MLKAPEAGHSRPSIAFLAALLLCSAASAVHVSTAAAADPVIAAAGDIACSSSSSNFNGGAGTADRCRARYTSDLLVNAGLAAVLPLGDTQYESASLSGLQKSYDLSWGRVKSISRPAPGNHEYKTTGAAGYFDYFNGVGVATGPAGDRSKGYYSFNVGTWHLIALNSTDHCTIIPCGAGSAQETWLKADLAANADKYCTLAYWHDPRFNSGHDGNADEMQPLFQALYNADADVILGGHAHDYERFAPQNPSGQLDNTRGIRQFVVGTGGAFWTSIGTPKPNSQIRQNNTYGVLKLTLHPAGYDWQFVSESNKPFTDSGTGQCHGGTPPPTGSDTQKPTPPTNLGATASAGQVALSWTASTDNVGVTGYRVYRGGTEIASLGTATSYTDTSVAGSTTYSYTVRAVDAAGNLSDPSNTASATTPATTTVTIAPEADALVNAGAPTTNYATAKLRTDGGSTPEESFLRFTVGGVAGSVQSAKLRVYAYTGTADGPAAYTTDNSWTETAINWNTRPLRTSAARDDKGAIASNSWVEFDVTPFVTGDGTYNFTLAQTASDGVDFRQREYATNRPELVLTIGLDTTKPTPPGSLGATAGPGQVALSWQASTDNIGVTGYRVYRGTGEIAALGPGVTSYTDTNLAAGPYSYTVRAVDAAGNLSDPSNTATATVPDTTKPSVPGNLTATAGTGQVALSWQASTDNVGVTGYRVFRGTTQIAALGAAATSYTDTNLAPGPYSYTVRAVDAAGNLSDPSNTATATVQDATKPTAPVSLSATAGTGEVALSWGASTDNVGVTGYRVYRDGTQVATVSAGTSHTDTGLAAGPYSYTVRAVDAAGNLSDPSNTAGATVPDTTNPTAPENLNATAHPGRVALNWNASTDDVGVTGYRVYREGAQIASTGAGESSYTDTNLAPGPYSYTVRAEDAAGNLSDPSNSASATVRDTTKPTAPSNLDATAGTGEVALSWGASTDDVGVTGYHVYREATQIATVDAGTSYTDTNVPPGSHDYTVGAVDAAANVSDPSNTASATVADVTKPTAPADLTATGGPGRVTLNWSASTDDVGVTGYRVYREGTQIATVDAGTSYTDTNLASGSYSYTVGAVDAAANVSDPSNTASATVPDTTQPTTPQNLTANLNGSSEVDLSWEAATDDVAVTSYQVYRGPDVIANLGPTATSYADTNLAAGTYSYTVRALDAAGNPSDFSTPASATVPDTTKPTAPANLAGTARDSIQVDLTWEESTDDVAVSRYSVYRDGELIATIDPATSYSDTVPPGTYTYDVRALDAAGNLSDPSNSVTVTVTPPDLEAPTPPANLSAAVTGGDRVDLAWDAASDNVGVTGYRIYRNGVRIATIDPATSYSDIVPPGTYSYEVRAVDAADNVSDPSNAASADVPDTAAPSAPANLTATAVGSTQVDLAWEASADNVAVTGYRIYRDGELLTGVDPSTSYSDNLVAPATHTYEVRALDAAGNVSDPSNSATADLEAPTPPTNMSATVTASGQVDLSWDASTDDVGVAGYRVYREGTQIATVDAGTSYADTNVSPGAYGYTVRAVDGAGNVSDPSNTASATVLDTTKPTAPANLTATSGIGQVELNWDASTDDVGVTGYRVYREGTQIATVDAGTSYTDTGLATGSYGYTVRATDAADNLSDPSNTANATVPDTTKPTAPANLSATAGAGDVALSWEPASDNVGVTGYRIYRDGVFLTAVGATTSHTDAGVALGTHSYEVRATDAAGNVSDPSNSVDVRVADTERPTAPANLTATAVSPSQIDLAWDASTDNVAVTAYEIYRDGALLTTIGPGTSYSDGVIAPATHTYMVRARDAEGNVSDPSNSGTASVVPPDTEGPTPPANLVATVTGSGDVELSWDTSIDNVGVTAYRIYRDDQLLTTVGATTSHTDTTVVPGSYSYTVRAEDAAGNLSDPSLAAGATVPDTEQPSAPANLNAVGGGADQVDLTWQASSDNVLVTGYRVYRDDQQIASLGAVTTFTDTGRPPGTYSYTVRAHDAAGNLSDPSNAASVTVPDTSNPTAPTGLGATASSQTQVDLTWEASSDDVAVTGYRIYRDGGFLADIGPATSYADTTVTAGNTYSYEVRAVDGAGHLSDPSNTATATTPAPTVSVTLSPEADALVNAGAPTTNYATSKLRADGGSTPEESLLRFTVNGVTAGTVRSAKLRVYAYTATADGPGVFTTATSWSETTVNWDTRPARTSALVDDKGAIPANTWVEYDVTPFVTGSGTYSLGLAMSVSDGVDFRSREYATNQPELVVDAGPPDTQKPTAPTGLTSTAPSPTRVDLAWQPSTDNVGVTGYRIYRGGSLLASVGTTTSYADTAVTAGNSYSYEVRAVDAANNVSDPSNAVTATTPSAASVVVFSPEADARVHESSPTTNYATSYLRANGGTESDVETFLRFTVTGAPAGVRSAKLRIFAYSGTADGPALYTTSTSWTETTVNWNTRPARTSGATDDKGSIPTNTWAEYDVTPFVTGNGTYSFTLVTTSNDGVDFRAREYTANRPELVVTLP